VPDAIGPEISPARHIVLVGAMGSGKTTIGRPLAQMLDRPFVDNDAQLLARTGMTAADLGAQQGIDALHDAESEALLAALRAPEPSVIAAAASTIVNPAARDALEHDAFVMWLRAGPAALAARMPRSPTRPFSVEDPARVVVQQARARDPLFAEVADLVVETDRSTPGDVVATIVERLPSELTRNR
jgi:shikimate kinase